MVTQASPPAESNSGADSSHAPSGAATVFRPRQTAAHPEPAATVSPSADSTIEAAPGATLSGRYHLEELLGHGGMGLVYRATDLQMPGVQVAIKLLKPELRAQPELLNMLRESVRKARSLPHPNIASVYSLESDRHEDFVIMELLQGHTLQTLLDDEYARGLPIGMARALIADLCSALAYAHDHGVIHSDLKPSNIFVTPSGHAKLFDFDIARVLRGPTGYFDASQVGARTLAYCSIEMELGERPDPRDDVYGLACVIYEMFSGVHPFGGASASEARKKGRQVKPLPVLRREENHALSQALKFDREERLESVEALHQAFVERKWRLPTLPSLRVWVIVGGVVGLLLCGVLGWWGWLRSPRTTHQQTLTASATAELHRAKALAAAASRLAVDEHDDTLRHGLALLGSLHDGDDSERTLQQARAASAALIAALAHSPRTARLGTSDSQLQRALDLCRELALRSLQCSAKALEDESPRSVSLRPFAIDSTPTTNAEYAGFVQATGQHTAAETNGMLYAPDPTRGWNIVLRGQNWRSLREESAARGEPADALPILGMDLESARAYCRWKGKRLPTEDEWEYNARGPSGRVFPWGDQPTPPAPLASHPLPVAETATVPTQNSRSNVAEWTETRVQGQRVLRGASWLLPQPYFQRLALRRLEPAGGVLDASFRCATSLESWPKSEGAP
jgi:Protein kinase domain/Sulfatase-modifying factor enzyme 1